MVPPSWSLSPSLPLTRWKKRGEGAPAAAARLLRPPAMLSTLSMRMPQLQLVVAAPPVAEHLNTPTRLRAVLRRLAAANAANHTSALEVWGSEEEDGEIAASAFMPSTAAAAPIAPSAYGRSASLPAVVTREDGGLPAAVLPARIVWRDDVRLTMEAAAAVAGRRQAGGVDTAGEGGCRGVLTRAGSTAWAAIVGALWEGWMGGKAPYAEDGASWWLLLRAVVLVALALVWMVAL
ncbi:hypothetical protein MMPV_006434 [Pyropia vietnamensis]